MLVAGAGSRNAIFGPLGDQASLEMRDCPEDVKDQLAGGRVSVDPFLQTEERVAALLTDQRPPLAPARRRWWRWGNR